MYYGLIILSVLMFGGCYALQDAYRNMRGSRLNISMENSFVGSLAGFVVLLIFNGFKIEFTPFTLLIALLASLNGIAFAFCSFKALDTINLSLFSLFSMLGGMVLPFLQGIIFYGEKLTLAKTKYPNVQSIVIAGGVSANQSLRSALPNAYFPAPSLSGDNGAMVAAAAYYEIQSEVKPVDPYKLNIYPRISIEH